MRRLLILRNAERYDFELLRHRKQRFEYSNVCLSKFKIKIVFLYTHDYALAYY